MNNEKKLKAISEEELEKVTGGGDLQTRLDRLSPGIRKDSANKQM